MAVEVVAVDEVEATEEQAALGDRDARLVVGAARRLDRGTYESTVALVPAEDRWQVDWAPDVARARSWPRATPSACGR